MSEDVARAARAHHPVSAFGIALTTIGALLFVFLWALESSGRVENPYLGLFAFIAIPVLFVTGLLLIPIGAWLSRRRARRGLAPFSWPRLDFGEVRVRRFGLLVIVATFVNVLIVSVAGYEAVHWMESPSFCGQVCHTPMEPHYTQWQQAPHARVRCVDCHVGSGAGAFVEAKLNGIRQLTGVVTGHYERPVPTPVRNMRPPEFTCARCHWPGRDIGDRVRVVREYADDESGSETTTVLRLHVGRGATDGLAASGIHWHTDPANEIEYIAADPARETIPWVRVKDGAGRVREYVGEGVDAKALIGAKRRMDCLDCHNRPAHPFAASPERAVDAAIADGRLSRSLPFVRREAVAALKSTGDRKDVALAAVAQALRTFYEKSHADVARAKRPELDRVVAATQELYRRHVFPSMKVTWGTYPNHAGHVDTPGCFRCHDDAHKAADGAVIRQDCDVCHTQEEAPTP